MNDTQPPEWMLELQEKNYRFSLLNPHESQVRNWLELKTPHVFNRQVIYGRKVFDFFCIELGLRVEVDGDTHVKHEDAIIDDDLLQRHGIRTIRVRNGNKDDLLMLSVAIAASGPWKDRINESMKPLTPFLCPLEGVEERWNQPQIVEKVARVRERVQNTMDRQRRKKAQAKKLRRREKQSREAIARNQQREFRQKYSRLIEEYKRKHGIRA